MAGPRAALPDLLLAAVLLYGVLNLAWWWAHGAQPRALLPVLGTLAPDLIPAAPAPGVHFALLAALDIASFLALAALAFLLLAGAARAAARRRAFPPPPMTRALGAATAPLACWLGACGDAADGIAGARTARDAALVMALGAYAAYAMAHAVDAMAVLTPHPGILLAAVAAAMPAAHAPALHPGAHAALYALGIPTFLSAHAVLPLLAMVALRAVAPACAWLRSKL